MKTGTVQSPRYFLLLKVQCAIEKGALLRKRNAKNAFENTEMSSSGVVTLSNFCRISSQLIIIALENINYSRKMGNATPSTKKIN